MIGRTNACVMSDQSWANYVAVRNRTKTTIEAGDIDVRSFTGELSAAYMFYGVSTLTAVTLDFRNINGSNAMLNCFTLCTNLTSVRLNLASVMDAIFSSVFNNCPSINQLTIDGLSDSVRWSSTSSTNNLFAASPALTTCQNLTITCAILPNLYLAVMTSLNFTSVVQVLGKLFDYAGSTAHTITFNRSFTGLSQSDYNLIHAAVTTANARNWAVAGLTYSM